MNAQFLFDLLTIHIELPVPEKKFTNFMSPREESESEISEESSKLRYCLDLKVALVHQRQFQKKRSL